MDLFDSSVTAHDFAVTTSVDMPNVTHDIHVPKIWNMIHLIMTSVILGVLILCTIVGNVFVIAAIIVEKNLHNVANYLILSLAVSDCMVAVIVMPVSAVNEVTQHWFMGPEVCDMWIAMDVLCCTASIYGLVAISIDRYWAVTNIDYIRKRTARRICTMIILVWIAAMSISIPSILMFKDDNDPDVTGICMISQDIFYTIFSTVGAFYLPTVILLIIYCKIFVVARKRILRKKFSEKRKNLAVQLNRSFSPHFDNAPEMTLLKVPHHEYTVASRSDISETPLDDSGNICDRHNHPTIEHIYFTSSGGLNNTRDEIMKAKREKEKLKRKRERKVARTLTIITGSFIICWLPFFIIALSAPFIRSKVNIPRLVESITLWLGYFNSLLNPIIYTMFNEEFRKAFKDLLCRKCFKRDTKRQLDLWI